MYHKSSESYKSNFRFICYIKLLLLLPLEDSDSEKETEQDFEASNVRGQQSVEKSYDRTPDIVLRPRKSRFRDADSPEPHAATDESPTAAISAPPIVSKRSREEVMQDIVRVKGIPPLFLIY